MVNNQKKSIEDQTQPQLLQKFADAPSAVVEVVVQILEKFGLNIPESAKNEIGIILLLFTIYTTGGILRLGLTIPMIIFTAIAAYTAIDILSDNSQKISRFFRGITNADNIIKKIRDGTLADAANEISLSTFDAEGINKLLELSKEGLLSYDLQNAIINTQYFYPKNLRTLFNKDSTINLYEDIVLKLLSKNYVKELLTDEQIQQIISKYKDDNKIVIKLLLNQPHSFKLIEATNDENLKKILLNCKIYLEKPFFLDRYFNTVRTIINFCYLILIPVLISIPISNFMLKINPLFPKELSFIIFALVFLFIIYIFSILNIHSILRRSLRNFIEDKKMIQILMLNKDSS